MTSTNPPTHRVLDIPFSQIAVCLPVTAFLCALSFFNYLLFHSIVEMFSVVVAAIIFVLAWTTKNYMSHHYLLFLGISYLFVGLTDLVHTLAYKGMGVFTAITANEPTQLWILARYMESLSLVIAPTYARRRVPFQLWLIINGTLTATGFFLIFQWKIFPDCYVEGEGLTPFKIVSEYVICGLVFTAGVRLYRIQALLDLKVFRLLLAALVATMIAELAFTFYVSVYGLSNMVGHLFKLLSFLLVFEGLVRTGIREPFALLFRQLKREKEELESALKEIKTLRGLLPICSFCKKIRDDGGYWHNLETYIRSRTSAEFSHGICPDCLRKHYPDLADDVLKNLEAEEAGSKE